MMWGGRASLSVVDVLPRGNQFLRNKEWAKLCNAPRHIRRDWIRRILTGV